MGKAKKEEPESKATPSVAAPNASRGTGSQPPGWTVAALAHQFQSHPVDGRILRLSLAETFLTPFRRCAAARVRELDIEFAMLQGPASQIIRTTHFQEPMNKLSFLNLVTLGAGIMAAQASYGQVVYDAAADFSVNSNPNGVWSYGYSTALGGAMTIHQQETQTGLGVGLHAWFSSSTQVEYPGIYVNPTASPIAYSNPGGGAVWGPHQLAMIPGPNGQFSILRFTSPGDGPFRVQGQYGSLDEYPYGPTVDVHILENGQSLFDGMVWGLTSVASFDTVVQLRTGDYLDFVVGPNAYGNGWDNTAVSVSITPVPEPTVLGLAGLGVGLLGCRARKPAGVRR